MDTICGLQAFDSERWCLDCGAPRWHDDRTLAGYTHQGKFAGHRLIEIAPARAITFGSDTWVFIEDEKQREAYFPAIGHTARQYGASNIDALRALPFPFWITARVSDHETYNGPDYQHYELITLTPTQIAELFGATQSISEAVTPPAFERRAARAQAKRLAEQSAGAVELQAMIG